MDVVYPRCAGLDVHNKTVVACVIVQGPKGQPQKTIRTFGTMSDDLLALGDWLGEQDVSHVAMESTGAYWRPIWNLLEEQFVLLLVNAHHIKQVPVARPTLRIASGSPICCVTVCSERASSRTAPSASCVS